MVRSLYWWPILALMLLFCGATTASADSGDQDSFLPAAKAFYYTVEPGGNGHVKLHWHVAQGYYLYRARLKIEGADASVANVDKPDGKLIHDPYFGDEQVYKHDVTIDVDPGRARQLKLTWQGCAEAGLCYPPQHASVDVPTSEGAGASPSDVLTGAAASAPHHNAAADQGPASQSEVPSKTATNAVGDDQAVAAQLAGGSLGWTLLAFFGMGLLLTFTPCVLPMLPILSGVIVGAGARGLRGAALSLAFVLPMAVTYALLGVAAALAGANLQAILQTPAVLGAFAAVFVVLALAMFGVFELQLPGPLRERLNRASARQRGGHVAGAAAMGVISAVLVGPCMTAPLAGALLYIAQSGNVVLGGLALLALGLGMGVPLLVVGALGARFMPRPGPWMNAVKAVFGFVLLGTALWMIGRVVPAPIMLGLWGALAIAAGITLALAVRPRDTTARTGVAAALTGAIVLTLWGVLMVIGAAGGAHDPWRPLGFIAGNATTAPDSDSASFNDRFQTVDDPDGLQQALDTAQRNGRWAVVDFYADWCVSCKVIDRQVFGNASVQQALADAALIRPDVTDDNGGTRELLRTLHVVGPPTILFIAPDGAEQRGARVVGELDAKDFLNHWRRAHRSADDAQPS